MDNLDFARVAMTDIDREANRARLQSLADQHLADKRDLPPPESATVLDAMIDAGEAEEPFIDYEAIAWAYQKLLAYGVGNTGMDNALMLDRLNLMLLTAEVA